MYIYLSAPTRIGYMKGYNATPNETDRVSS